MSVGMVATIATPPGIPRAADIPETQVRSNLMVSSANSLILLRGIFAFKGDSAIAISIMF